MSLNVATSDLLFLVAGLALLLGAWLPRIAAGRAFSAPMVFVAAGLLLGLLPLDLPTLGLAELSQEAVRATIEHVTEVVVIVALFGVGLAIDRPFGWRRWATTWRLLGIAMPLCIAIVAVLGWGVAGLLPASALLLGAVLAPTDPVLASEVQVGGPSDDKREDEDDVRFALTSEAGLNDGLAFPFVYAAVFLTTGGIAAWGPGWLAWELLGKVAIGIAAGMATGWVLARLTFARPARYLRFAETSEALVALAAVFVVYGTTEVVGGYGFLAVFVAALVLRAYEREHDYHRVLHEFVEQIERLLTLAVLLALGYACADGLLAALTPGAVVVAVALVFVVRPLVGWLSLAGCGLPAGDRWAVAFFGVRGIGSFYYLAYAAGQTALAQYEALWSAVAFTVLLSVVIHGISAGPAMSRLDAARARQGPST
jgi:NhaP-type Na+/H+ or K+/H+ antiporter